MLERRPLYEQVRQQVLDYIAGQDLQPGDIIPTEADLASRYGVSVGTVRRALRQLVDQEILYRQPGRGTFLTEHSRQRARQRGFLACIVPYIRNAFASNVIAGAQYAAQRADYGFLLYNSYGQPDLEEELLLQSLGSITGALLVPVARGAMPSVMDELLRRHGVHGGRRGESLRAGGAQPGPGGEGRRHGHHRAVRRLLPGAQEGAALHRRVPQDRR